MQSCTILALLRSNRPLSTAERQHVARELEARFSALESSYEGWLDRQIAILKNTRYQGEHSVQVNDDGTILGYRLFFRSPSETWANLCGREGFFAVNPETFETTGFEITVMS